MGLAQGCFDVCLHIRPVTFGARTCMIAVVCRPWLDVQCQSTRVSGAWRRKLFRPSAAECCEQSGSSQVQRFEAVIRQQYHTEAWSWLEWLLPTTSKSLCGSLHAAANVRRELVFAMDCQLHRIMPMTIICATKYHSCVSVLPCKVCLAVVVHIFKRFSAVAPHAAK